MFNKARILITPLDWGLGHATRCIPIIRALLDRNAVPVIGADHGPLTILTEAFPHLEHVRIPGVEVRYGRGSDQRWSMLRQFPRMVRSVRAERNRFERLMHTLAIDAVISDQRFGIRSPELPSILITHQVFPFSPMAQRAVRELNLQHIGRFDRCWIMDEPEAPGLAGELSHGLGLPTNCIYIGSQSRMRRSNSATGTSIAGGPFRILAVISGPEPQRTLFENALKEQLGTIDGKHLIVRGRPDGTGVEHLGNITLVGHLNGEELGVEMTRAEMIVSRSGYTTLMDLAALGRSALIIPTPGQSEQEYLGELHASTGRSLMQTQAQLDLRRALDRVPGPSTSSVPVDNALLEQALKDLASMLH